MNSPYCMKPIRPKRGLYCGLDSGHDGACAQPRKRTKADRDALKAASAERERTRQTRRDPIDTVWKGIKRRCHNPANRDYRYYGAKGIRLCDEWQDFEKFKAAVGPAPPGMTLDRIDNSKGYEPGNVRYATRREQSLNRANTRLNSEAVKVVRWYAKRGVSHSLLARIHGCGANHISNICAGRTWGWVSEGEK